MKEKVIVCTTDNDICLRELTVRDGMVLDGLQEIVGGYIEVVHPIGLDRPYCMVVNEEGRLIGLEKNVIGSLVYGMLIHGEPIVGNIAILKDGWRNGERDIVGLDEDDIPRVCEMLERALAPVKGAYHDKTAQ